MAEGKTSAKPAGGTTAAAKKPAASTKAGAARKPTKPRRSARVKAVEEAGRRYFDAIAARDPDGMAACWHPEGVDEILPLGIFRGPEEVRRLFRELFTAMPDSSLSVERITADHETAAVQWRMTGTFSGGPFQGIEPTGKRVELRGVDCLQVDEEGRLTGNVAYYDGAAFARAIGMLPPEDSGADRAIVAGFNAVTKLRRAVADR